MPLINRILLRPPAFLVLSAGEAYFFMLTTLLSGFTIALAFAAPPGPVAMETIRHGLRGGFFPALRVQLGSILGDLAWCMLALFGLAPILQADWIRLPVAAAGSIILVALGIAAFRDAILGSEALFRENAGRPGGSFRIGAVISLGNPMAPAFWISIGGAMAAAGTLDWTRSARSGSRPDTWPPSCSGRS